MKTCTLKLLDQVNVKLDGIDPGTMRKASEAVSFMVPWARFSPSFKLGRWNGKKEFLTGNRTYINLLDRILPVIIENGYEIEIEDNREAFSFDFEPITEDYLADRVWPKGHAHESKPIMLRDYQVNAINNYMQNPQSMQSLATSAGKTIISATLSLLVERLTGGRTLVIVPSKTLVKQTYKDFVNIGLDTGCYFGEEKAPHHQHVICTWQSLSILAKDTRQNLTEFPIDELLKDVVCFQLDECHTGKAKEVMNLLGRTFAKVPIRFGLTGTIPKEDFDYCALLGVIGPVVGQITAHELQQKGSISTCEIEMIELDDSHVEFSDYHEEHKFLTTDRRRVEWIADFCRKIAERDGNTLVLVQNIELGKALSGLCEGSNFVYGLTSLKDRASEYDAFAESNNKLLFAGFGVASTGVSIDKIRVVVLIEAGKSAVKVIQSIGRGLRLSKDKNHAKICDLYSCLKFSKRHAAKRRTMYDEAKYPYTKTKIKYR